MHLTRIELDAREALKLKLIDAYAWHQRLWEAFPGRDGEPRDFLSRTEMQDGHHRTLLLSPEAPTRPGWGHWQTKAVAPAFLEHGSYAFNLRANPVVRTPSRPADGAPRPRGRRTPILNPDGLASWLMRKAEVAGFSVDRSNFEVGAPIRQPFRKQGRTGVHTRVDFQGVLTVQDRDAFKRAFRQGIGPGKAFGFGMLTLRPVA